MSKLLNSTDTEYNVEEKGAINDDAFKSVMMTTNIIIAVCCLITIIINNQLHTKSIEGIKKVFNSCVLYTKNCFEHNENVQQSFLNSNFLNSGESTPSTCNPNYNAEEVLAGASAKVADINNQQLI